MVDEAVDEGRRHDLVAENLAPFLEAFVGLSTVEACLYGRVMSWKKSMAPVRLIGR